MFWRPYVSVAKRRALAAKEATRHAKQGAPLTPVAVGGRAIASTFWGQAWCENLEQYSDFENRLPRGRTYVRNGSVIDLKVERGEVKALVMGSELYRVSVKVKAVPGARWKALCRDCAQGIDSLVELLQGRFAKGVMERICAPGKGLFPAPPELELSCSCPDYASMCKHVAATLYGVGARLDSKPELLFELRGADHGELVRGAGARAVAVNEAPKSARVLEGEGLSEVFGIELAEASAESRGAEGGDEAPAAPVKRKVASAAKAPVRPRGRAKAQELGGKPGGRAPPRGKPKKSASERGDGNPAAIAEVTKRLDALARTYGGVGARRRGR